jgi:AcrR family transcriptional regulator
MLNLRRDASTLGPHRPPTSIQRSTHAPTHPVGGAAAVRGAGFRRHHRAPDRRGGGVSDGALYAHFASKQAISDRLIESMGPPTPNLLGVDAAAMIQAGAKVAIPAAVDRLLLAYWSEPDVRTFTAVLLREGGSPSTAAHLAASIEGARTALTPVFAIGSRPASYAPTCPARQIVSELLAPLNVIRFLHLGYDASPAEITDARQIAAEHLAYFRAYAFTSDNPD